MKRKDKSFFLNRYIRGWYTRSDLDTCLPHLLHPDNRIDTINELETLWEEAQEKSTSPDEREFLRYKQEALSLLRAIRKEEENVSFQKVMMKWVKYAALFIFVSGITFGIYKISGSFSSSQQMSYTTIKVENGQHKTLTLSDGSVVVLNACSKLVIPDHFTGDERRVRLNGEAYFSVAPDKDMPFIVETDDMTVQVLGTSFNMKVYSEDSQYSICVESGKVQVDLAEAMIRLTPNEQVIVDKTNKEFFKQQELSSRVLSWRNKGLYFNRTPLKSVINELYRVYDQPIELASDVDSSILIYGEHDNENLESVLKSVCLATGLKYRQEAGKMLVYKP